MNNSIIEDIIHNKKVTLLVGSYYPNYSAVGRCQGNIAEELVERGADVTVIAQGKKSNVEYINGQKVITTTIKHYEDLAYRIKRRFVRLVKLTTFQSEWVSAIENVLDNLSEVPDIVIACCIPFESVVALSYYKEKHPEVYCGAYLYDMYAESDTVYTCDIERRIKRIFNKKKEHRVLGRMDILYCTPSWLLYVKRDYKDLLKRCFLFEHPLIVKSCLGSAYEVKDFESSDKKQGKVKLAFAGALIRGYVEAKQLVELLRKSKYRDYIDMSFFSVGSGVEDIKNVQGINVENYGWISHKDLHRKLSGMDILVSIAEKKGKQMSSKIFEYMCHGKPILHIHYAERDVNLHYLKRYPLALTLNLGGGYKG